MTLKKNNDKIFPVNIKKQNNMDNFKTGLNLITGKFDSGIDGVFENIKNRYKEESFVTTNHEMLLKCISENKIKFIFASNIFGDLHPGLHRELAKKINKDAKDSNIIIIATCYSPTAISVIEADHVFEVKNNKIYHVDNSIGLNSVEIMSFFMGIKEYPEEVDNLIKDFNYSIDDKDQKKAEKVLKKLENMINQPHICPLVSKMNIDLKLEFL